MDKKKRRAKRQLKSFNNKLVQRTIKKLFGDSTTIADLTYHPSKDQTRSNKERLLDYRISIGNLIGKKY